MGENYYTDIWKKYLPVIMLKLKQPDPLPFNIPKEEFVRQGNRQEYSFTITYTNGKAPTKDGSAVCRDFQDVIKNDKRFIDLAKDKTIKFTLDKRFNFNIHIDISKNNP